jgi:hypothetical protein
MESAERQCLLYRLLSLRDAPIDTHFLPQFWLWKKAETLVGAAVSRSAVTVNHPSSWLATPAILPCHGLCAPFFSTERQNDRLVFCLFVISLTTLSAAQPAYHQIIKINE